MAPDVRPDALCVLKAMGKPTEVLELAQGSHELSSVEFQDLWGNLLTRCPSHRYRKELLRMYIQQVDNIESESLLKLIYETNLEKIPIIPDPNESCYFGFPLLGNEDIYPRIRVYPYHNDVSLRLWEAGATLAEYLLQHDDLVQNEDVIELGAGVGLTSIVAAHCHASSVHMTDYTEECLVNLRHNLDINRKWLQGGDRVTAGHLDWHSLVKRCDNETCDVLNPEIIPLTKASVLLAADVAYIREAIHPLACTIAAFLRTGKYSLLATTRRNEETFGLLQNEMRDAGISWEEICSDCDLLPVYFPCRFNQPRSDVRIWKLTFSKQE